MGAVYEASPLDGGAAVAIKILHAHFIGDTHVLQRFLEEGRTYMRLVHANILRAHECLTAEDGSPYLVTDLLEGVPLSAYTKNGGRVSIAHAIPILQGILAGIDAAHEKGVVHRDLKPANVFLAREPGGLFAVKLLDFGIAKVMEIAGGMGKKTRTGVLLGTPAYMSPEQIRSAKDVDGRADLWSAGVMFYEMLTGRTAFPAPTEYARLAAVLQSIPEPIERVDPQLSALRFFVARAMQKDPALRFQSAREMALALGVATSASERQPPSGVVVSPLSRLPEHLWFSPDATLSRAVETLPLLPPPKITAPVALQTTAPPFLLAEARHDDTLASAGLSGASAIPPSSAPLSQTHAEAKPGQVRTLATGDSLPKRQRLAPTAVVALVVFALMVGLAVGYALGRGWPVDLGQSECGLWGGSYPC
jgi:serine/threonine-protein kinase